MTAPFKPRKSLLAGQHPVSQQSVDVSSQEKDPDYSTSTRVEMKKMTIQLPLELSEKIRGAVLLHGVHQGIYGPSAWIADVVQREIDRIESETGALPRIKAGNVPQGWNAR